MLHVCRTQQDEASYTLGIILSKPVGFDETSMLTAVFKELWPCGGKVHLSSTGDFR